jgi:hypothetical protein
VARRYHVAPQPQPSITSVLSFYHGNNFAYLFSTKVTLPFFGNNTTLLDE